MQNREWIYAVIVVASFVLMTGSLVLAYANAGEEGVGIAEFASRRWRLASLFP